jgi:hypothetical protein
LFQTLLKKRDFYAGGLVLLLGSGVTLNALSYNTGTLMHMGPGMFPFILGIVLTVIGALILGTAVVTPLSDNERILPTNKEWLGWGCILAGPILFIFVGEFFGMAPATFACVFVSALGDRESTLKSSAVLALGVTILGSVIFGYVLQLPFPIFRWGH